MRLFFTSTARMYVCCGYVIDDCKTVDMTEGEIALAFLGVESKYRKTDEELRERIRAGGCVQTREQHDHFGAGMPEVFSLSEIVI